MKSRNRPCQRDARGMGHKGFDCSLIIRPLNLHPSLVEKLLYVSCSLISNDMSPASTASLPFFLLRFIYFLSVLISFFSFIQLTTLTFPSIPSSSSTSRLLTSTLSATDKYSSWPTYHPTRLVVPRMKTSGLAKTVPQVPPLLNLAPMTFPRSKRTSTMLV
jgi:hypothetical protein